jgi:hypothetical protein
VKQNAHVAWVESAFISLPARAAAAAAAFYLNKSMTISRRWRGCRPCGRGTGSAPAAPRAAAARLAGPPHRLRKTNASLFSQLFLCLSRACLGVRIIYMYKKHTKTHTKTHKRRFAHHRRGASHHPHRLHRKNNASKNALFACAVALYMFVPSLSCENDDHCCCDLHNNRPKAADTSAIRSS